MQKKTPFRAIFYFIHHFTFIPEKIIYFESKVKELTNCFEINNFIFEKSSLFICLSNWKKSMKSIAQSFHTGFQADGIELYSVLVIAYLRYMYILCFFRKLKSSESFFWMCSNLKWLVESDKKKTKQSCKQNKCIKNERWIWK